MSITVRCPGHGGPLQLPDNAGGKKVRCPMCQTTFEVPASAASETLAITAPAPPPTPAPVETPAATSVTAAAAQKLEPPVSVETKTAVTEKTPKAPPKPPPIKKSSPEAAETRRRIASKGSATGYTSFVLLGVGVLVLGLCCVGGGIGGWFFLRSGPGPAPIAQENPEPLPPDQKVKDLNPGAQPPVAVKLVNGVFQIKTEVNPEERDEGQDFRRRKRFAIQAKAGTAYLVEATDPMQRVNVRVEPPGGGQPIQPKPGGINSQVIFLAEKDDEYIAVAARHSNDARETFTMTIKEVDESSPLPDFQKLTPVNPALPPKIEIAVSNRDRFMEGGAFAPDSKSYWTSHHDMTLTLWKQPYEIQGTFRMTRRLYALAVDSKGRLYGQPGPPSKSTTDRNRSVGDIEVYEGLNPKGENAMPTPTKIIPLAGLVKRILSSPDGRWLYVLDTHNRKVCRIDTEKVAIDKTIDTISTSTSSFCLTPNGKKIYCCSETNRIDIIDAEAFKLERSVNINKGQPKDIAANDQGMVFIVGQPFDGSGNAMVVDLTKKVEDRMNVYPVRYGIYSTHLQMAPDGKTVFLSGDRRVGACVVPTRPALYPIGVRETMLRDFFRIGWFQISPDGRTMLHDAGTILSISR